MKKTMEKIFNKVVKNNNRLDLSDMDVWLNNSDGEDGEYMQVSAIGFNNGVFGVYVYDDDFFPFDELSDDEIEVIYNAVEDFDDND